MESKFSVGDRKISIQIPIVAFLDDTQVKQQQSELEVKNEKISKNIDENEKRTKESFNEVIGMMRASYMMVTGVADVIGKDMGQIFSAIYAVASGTIQTSAAIAAALAASGPVGWIQAGLMGMSLTVASVSLVGVMSGQKDLAQKISGFNTILQGFGGMIDSMSFLW